MPLLIHGEITDKDVDIFDREKIFIDKVLKFICESTRTKITLEHITTKEAVSFVNETKKIWLHHYTSSYCLKSKCYFSRWN